MSSSILHIKNMVCNRCIRVVGEELGRLGFHADTIDLGKVVLKEEIDEQSRERIRNMLSDNGFELIDDKKSLIINRIKTLVIEYIHYDREESGHVNFSEYLASELGHDYSYLSTLYSSVEGQTIEKYLILQKVEKVKELLVYDELSLSEIAYQLRYSSVQHLSNQFKKITGLSPSHFKSLRVKRRKSLDQV